MLASLDFFIFSLNIFHDETLIPILITVEHYLFILFSVTVEY